MRMQSKAAAFYATYMAGGVGVGALLHQVRPDLGFLGLATWFLIFGAAQFLVLRCPHCGACSVIRPNGTATPIVGTSCAHCGERY